MTAVRADNAARDLLARLTDEAELESAPLDEVRADLAKLDVDPTRAIRFSRTLAEQVASPAGNLLAKSLAAEDSDREVSALELADPAAVRAELSAAAPLAMAHVERLANKAASHSTRRQPSRRLWYSIGGAITALAASVLIVVSMSMRDDGMQTAYAPDSATRSQEEQSAAFTHDSATAPPAAALQIPEEKPAEPVVDNSSRVARGISDDAEALRIFEQLSMTPDGIPLSGGGSTSGEFRPAQQASGLPVTSALILQPDLAPEPLRQSDLAAGDLQSHLPVAARSQASRSIVALVTLEYADGTKVDAMLVRMRAQYLRKSEFPTPNKDTETSLLSEPVATAPTLGRLLGQDVDDFLLIEIKPPEKPAGDGTAP